MTVFQLQTPCGGSVKPKMSQPNIMGALDFIRAKTLDARVVAYSRQNDGNGVALTEGSSEFDAGEIDCPCDKLIKRQDLPSGLSQGAGPAVRGVLKLLLKNITDTNLYKVRGPAPSLEGLYKLVIRFFFSLFFTQLMINHFVIQINSAFSVAAGAQVTPKPPSILCNQPRDMGRNGLQSVLDSYIYFAFSTPRCLSLVAQSMQVFNTGLTCLPMRGSVSHVRRSRNNGSCNAAHQLHRRPQNQNRKNQSEFADRYGTFLRGEQEGVLSTVSSTVDGTTLKRGLVYRCSVVRPISRRRGGEGIQDAGWIKGRLPRHSMRVVDT
ncbi:hypothetical protein VP01_1050g1 [Puccinia sorghi]|uniref:Uncharacterized protein n=1 Tax=Puccinia sorghi TaxID=27349 RepID=A0A0L6VUD9_9BASI|nr:hypothetical protein VP01_1050g1 [Puccinia sorghi]